MRKFRLTAVLCALWIAFMTIGPTIGQTATITLVRGMQVEIFDTAKKPAGGVHIGRPAVSPSKPPPPPAKKRKRVNSFYAAGDILWRRNARTGRLTACSVGRSGMVGRDVIRCTSSRAIWR